MAEPALPNWLTLHVCPRVSYRVAEESTQDDISKFLSSYSRYCVTSKHDWHIKILETTLYIYEFDSTNFYFDDCLGFYVSELTEIPIFMMKFKNLYEELLKKNIKVEILNNL